MAGAKDASQKPDLGTPLTRRELLNYVWLGSLGVFLAQLGGASLLFALPRFRVGEFGGIFEAGDASIVPAVDDPPLAYNEGKFWLVNSGEGVLAIYRVCTHLGCLYAWQAAQDRFICPCHGSQFQKGGKYLQGPAPRSLDAFNLIVVDAAGTKITDTKTVAATLGVPYAPVPIADGQRIQVDTGDLINSGNHDAGF
jgi:cytochrome b6-f complex iron-sulfur subunit